MNISAGFIGLGIMGRPMALNLIRGGHTLGVFSRRVQALSPLLEAGAVAYKSPAELASVTNIVFTILSDTPDVEEVIFGHRGLLEGIKPGSVLVDMSTISPQAVMQMANRLRDRNIAMLDAPVSGGETGAINASLSFMVGGEKDIFQRIKPFFTCMGKNIVHIGPSGAGQIAKACNQIVTSMTIAGVAEAFTLARKNGVDPARVREALLGGFAYSKILEAHGQRMLERNFQPGFKVELFQKDINIVLNQAHRMGIALPGTALISQYFNALVGSGDGHLDSAALLLLIERFNGMGESEPK